MKKRKHICLVMVLCSLLLSLAGCSGKEGQKESGNREEEPLDTKELVIDAGTSGIDIVSESEKLFRLDNKDREISSSFLRMQYYKGEPIQLWMQTLDSKGNPLEFKIEESEGQTVGYWGPREYEDGSEAYVTRKLFLYRADGTKEFLIGTLPVLDRAQDGPKHIVVPAGQTPDPNSIRKFDKRWASNEDHGRWYLSQDGACYCWWDFEEGNNGEYTFMKIDPSGEVAYSVLLEDYIRVRDILQLPDGRIFLILRDKPAGVTRVAEIDPDTGALDGPDVAVDTPGSPGKKWTANVGFIYGMDEEGNIYLLPFSRGPNIGGIYRLDLSDGGMSAAMSFIGTSYTLGDSTIDMTNYSTMSFMPDELRVLPDGSIEILWRHKYYKDKDNTVTLGVRETLRPASADRPTVTIRAEAFSDWTKKQVNRFNRTNSRWRVVLEEYASSNAADLEEYARLTSVQIATGKGPDMLYGNFMDSYVPGMLEKGALLELSGPLKESGVRAGDYLPLTFDEWRVGDSVYGVTAEPGAPQLYTIDSRVLGGDGEPDIKALVKALQAWEEDGVLLGYNNSSENLRRFLQGSEDLCGMVDWEKGTCDFSGDLFKGLLEVSKRYGYDERRRSPNLVRSNLLGNIYQYMNREDLAAAGRTVCGTMYNDGCHGTVRSTRTLMVNAASDAREGALEFLCLLLGEDAQKASASGSFPVSREMLEEWVRIQAKRVTEEEKVTADISYIDNGEMVKDIKVYTEADMTEERIQEYLSALEDVRALPARNRPIIDIICEEAEYYFNGSKSVKEVAKVIKSKVGLYLAERR